MSNNRFFTVVAVFACAALIGVLVLMYMVLQDNQQSADERAANTRSIQVLSALTCEITQRLRSDTPEQTLNAELDREGYVTIAPICSQFVNLLREDLVLGDGRVLLRETPPER